MKFFTSLFALSAVVAAGLAAAQAPEDRPRRPEEIGRGEAPPAPQRQPGDRPHRPDGMMERADTNKDGKLSYEEISAVRPEATRERFEQMDRNNDGFLSRADRVDGRGGARGVGDGRQEMARQILSTDANDDGNVSYEELEASKPGFPKEAFSRIDRNADGFISEEELKRPAREAGDRPHRPGPDRNRAGVRGDGPSAEQRARMRERMMEADTDGDGRLSQSEASAAMPGMTPERFQRMDQNGDGYISPEDRSPRSPQR